MCPMLNVFGVIGQDGTQTKIKCHFAHYSPLCFSVVYQDKSFRLPSPF